MPEAVAAEIGRGLGVPLAEVHGVIEFYSLLYDRPVGNTILRVCADPTCAHQVYIYIRGEYPTAVARMKQAIEECKLAGYVGENILGSGFDLAIELRSGACAYICGEETALFESIEGKRGFPRVKPPFPATPWTVRQTDGDQ